jgi:hypothetical protein
VFSPSFSCVKGVRKRFFLGGWSKKNVGIAALKTETLNPRDMASIVNPRYAETQSKADSWEFAFGFEG